MKRTNRILWIVIVPVVLTTVFVWGFHSYYSFSEDKSKDSLIIESVKALLQVAGVAALGGWFKFLYDEVTEQRRQAEKIREQEKASQAAANEIRKGLLNELIAARSRVEEARIKHRIEETINPLEQYRATILAILDARLSLSGIWNAIETSNYLFPMWHKINSNINKMKLYLDELINEYESQIEDLRKPPDEELISRLRRLEVFGDFIGNAETSNYGARFLVEAYRPAVSEIRKEVLRARKVSVDEVPDQ